LTDAPAFLECGAAAPLCRDYSLEKVARPALSLSGRRTLRTFIASCALEPDRDGAPAPPAASWTGTSQRDVPTTVRFHGNSSQRLLRYPNVPATVSASRLFETRAPRSHERVGRDQNAANVSPSPEGEGRGEGECCLSVHFAAGRDDFP